MAASGTVTTPSAITNNATMNFTTGSLSATVNNAAGGVINYSSSGAFNSAVTNYGTIYATGSAANMSNFTNYGTLHIDAGVTLIGAYNNYPTFDASSVLEGDGTFKTGASGPYTYNAIVNPGTDGTIGAFTFNTWDANFSRTVNFTTTTVVNIDIASTGTAGTNFDKLTLATAHPSALDGTLNISSISGYTPTSGDTFSGVMTYVTGSSGTFTITHDFGAGWYVAADYGTTSLNLTVLDAAGAVTGTTGNDTLLSLASNDTITGDTGTDTVLLNGALSDYTFDFVDASTLQLVDTVGTDGTDTITGVETLKFTDYSVTVGSNSLTGDANHNNFSLAANQSGVTVAGGGGTDTVTLSGTSSDSNAVTLSSISGTVGSDGADTVTFTTALNNHSVNLGLGDDTVYLADVNNIQTFQNVEHIFGGIGNDNIASSTAFAAGDSVTVDGGAGTDNLNLSGAGNNTVTVSGVETINGGIYDDVITVSDATVVSINAGTGNDVITGNEGADILNGEGGADTFVYVSGSVNAGDLTAGMGDTTDATIGDSFDFSAGVEGALQIGGTLASGLATNTALSSSLSATDDIALVNTAGNYTLEIDFDGNQVSDFSIDVADDVTTATYDSANDVITLS